MEPVREVVVKHYLDISDIPHTTSADAYKASMHQYLVKIIRDVAEPYPAVLATHILNNFTVSLPRK